MRLCELTDGTEERRRRDCFKFNLAETRHNHNRILTIFIDIILICDIQLINCQRHWRASSLWVKVEKWEWRWEERRCKCSCVLLRYLSTGRPRCDSCSRRSCRQHQLAGTPDTQPMIPAGKAGNLIDVCSLFLSFYWLTVLIASRGIYIFSMIWVFLIELFLSYLYS